MALTAVPIFFILFAQPTWLLALRTNKCEPDIKYVILNVAAKIALIVKYVYWLFLDVCIMI
jgi:hypothetical protein